MFLNLVKAVEPYLKAISHRVVARWKGNHITYSDLKAPAAVPWGFVSQKTILESVSADRADGKVEKRAEYLNLDTYEFLRGAEEAYRCAALHFAPPLLSQLSQTSSSAPGNGMEVGKKTLESLGGACRGDEAGSGRDDAGLIEEGEAGSHKQGTRDAAAAATTYEAASSNFMDLDVASPEMSMFLNDVLESYRALGLVPRLSVLRVEATLCNAGVRLGGISKNKNFLGLMSADEWKYHLTMGMVGPEGDVINELEGRAPRKVIADVCLVCEEEFLLEDEDGRVVDGSQSRGPKVHYLTLQSNVVHGEDLEWQITNINDVIKPNLAYYFSRFGH